ncbi:MAG: hypothetical protein DME04_00740 [Candidatus Rokuibacteriota bacterium]|nr:MAG: hypothetical protein DME04_00740 [Candidatus Rokubacteria bacterium]
MKALKRRAVSDAGELARVLAQCASELEPGLRLLQRAAAAGEVSVDLLCVDASRRLVVVVSEVVASPETVLRALEGVAWWREHTALLERMLPGAGVDPHGAPRALIAAARFGDRALRLLRALGAAAPDAVECYLFEGAEGLVVAFDRVVVAPGTRPPAAAEAAPTDEAQRAGALVESLERLRFREVFR